MKIGYINIRSPIPAKGPTGRTVHIQEVCRAWRKLGHEVFIITGTPLSISVDVRIFNLSVPTPLSFDRFRRKIISIASSVYNKIGRRKIVFSNQGKENKLGTNNFVDQSNKISWSPRILYRDIVQIINEYQYDNFVYKYSKEIIETEKPDFLYQRLYFGESTGVRLSEKYKLPLIIEVNASNTFRNEWTIKHTYFFELVRKGMENRVCRKAEAVAVVTSFVKDYLVGQNVPSNKIFINSNGVNLDRYYQSDSLRRKIRKQYSLDDKIVVGFLGNFRPWHDVGTLIQCARIVINKFTGTHFLLVGDGPSRYQFEKMSNAIGIRACMTFTGNVLNEQVPGYINAMDIAVAPIPKGPFFHGSPVKIFEYLAMSKPVITSRYPDIESIITHRKNGILVEPGNKVELANAISELINNKELREQLGIGGRRSVEKSYTWERNAKKILDIYSDIKHKKACV